MNGTPTATQPTTWALARAYFLIYVAWGSTYFFIGNALHGFPPFLLGALRFTVAGLLLLSYCRLRGEAVFRIALARKSAACGLVLLFIDMALVMVAQQYLSSSLVAILASSTLIWMMALDFPRWKINFRVPSATVGVLAGFAGVALLYAEQGLFAGGDGRRAFGVVLLLFGCISWALGTLYAQYRTTAHESTTGCGGAAWQMLAAGAAFWVCSLAGRETEGFDWRSVGTGPWLSLGYLITFGSILAYTSYIWLLKVRPAQEVGTHAYVNPVVAVILGTVVGGESVSGTQLAGLGIILLSLFLIRRAPFCQRDAQATPLFSPAGGQAGTPVHPSTNQQQS